MSERRLTITDGVDQAIRRHGQETYPHECCGALIGGCGHVTEIVALPNTTEEGPRRRFLVRPSPRIAASPLVHRPFSRPRTPDAALRHLHLQLFWFRIIKLAESN